MPALLDRPAPVPDQAKGKHVGPQLGFPATNKEVELPMVAVYHVDGDRIHKARLYFDAAAFMRQLGM